MYERKKVNTQLITLIISIILLFEGILLLVFPTEALPYILIIPAVGFLCYGVIAIIVYKLKKNREGITKKTYVLPIIALVLGALMIIFNKETGYILPVIIGAFIIICSCIMLKKASLLMSCKVFERVLGGLSLGSGIALVVLGIWGNIYDRTLFVGILFFIFGALDLIYQLVFAFAYAKKQPRVK